MLKMRLCKSNISSSPQPQHLNTGGQCSLNPSPLVIPLLPFLCLLLPSYCLQRFMLLLWTNHQVTWSILATRTERSLCTGTTISDCELDVEDRSACYICSRRPTATFFTLRTGDLLSFPIDPKLTEVIAAVTVCLPTNIRSHWTNQSNAIVRLRIK